jgi:cytochrome c oxidase cbb3-type subunit I
MSDLLSSQPISADTPDHLPAAAPSDIDGSCRLPLFAIFLCSAVWLLIGSVFGLIASLKFHSPDFLANSAWLTYGRVRPAYLNCVLYGFCLQAGLGVTLYVLARLGRTPLAQRWLVAVGVKIWNLGLAAGILGILAGDSTGFENLEFPPYAAALLFLGYLLIGVWALFTFHQRRQHQLFVSQWFLLAALFWFPWIYSTANLLLTTFPVRGVVQAILGWWYSENLIAVWLALVGLATVFYFLPKLLEGRLHSHYLALLTFWMLILFASWGGIPASAPVPAWMPIISKVATILTVVLLIAVLLNVGRTAWPPIGEGTDAKQGAPAQVSAADSTPRPQPSRRLRSPLFASPSVAFILFGVTSFAVAGVMKIALVLSDVSQLQFTWFVSATKLLNSYGFFAMVMFGAIYSILPRLTGIDFPRPRLVQAHFWLVAAGITLVVLPQAIGGIVQSAQLANARVPFSNVSHVMLHFLRLSTVGDLLLLTGHLVFLGNVFGLVARFYRSRLAVVHARATIDLFQSAEVKL